VTVYHNRASYETHTRGFVRQGGAIANFLQTE
jgi:hypothetical protein